MLVHSLNNELFVHVGQVIPEGRLMIINTKNKVVKEFKLTKDNFFCMELDIPTGKYLIRLISPGHQMEKSVFIKRSDEDH